MQGLVERPSPSATGASPVHLAYTEQTLVISCFLLQQEVIMRKILIAAIAVGALNISTGVEAAPQKNRVITGEPSHPSTSGQSHRSPNAKTQGANSPTFCPPGQRRKPGKGSAFNC